MKLCDCHGEPMYRAPNDGWYRCRVKRRETVRRHEDRSFQYRAKKGLYERRWRGLRRREARSSTEGD